MDLLVYKNYSKAFFWNQLYFFGRFNLNYSHIERELPDINLQT